MKRFDRYIRAFDASLEKRPKVFDPVRVNLSVNVFLCMIDNAVDKFLLKVPIARVAVAVHVRALLNMSRYMRMQRLGLSVRDYVRSHFAVTLKQPHNGNLASTAGSKMLALRSVHVARQTADE